ncbi:hypothetical protein P4S72_10910 [Vibrio sp. PP-XX7]
MAGILSVPGPAFYTFDRALNVSDKVETYSIVELIVHPSSPSRVSLT